MLALDTLMASTMVASQFELLESPTVDETDVAVIDGDAAVDRRRCRSRRRGTRLVGQLVASILARRPCRRVLLVPPDHTRLHSRAGVITVELVTRLEAGGVTVGVVLPALGTQVRMSAEDTVALFRPGLGYERLLHHDWRRRLPAIGEIAGDEVSTITGGSFDQPIPVEVDEQLLFEDWDLVVSIGQVVPHEVIGMANFTKNIVIGLGGAPTIHRSHFVGAVVGMGTAAHRPPSRPTRHRRGPPD